MVNKIIADYLKTNKRLIVPQFGAFLHKDDGTVAFVPFLKKDDGVLIRLIGSAYGVNPGDAQAAIEEFTAEIKKHIAAHGAYIIEGIGTLKMDSNSIYYLDSGQKAAQTAAAQTPAAAAPAPMPAPAATVQPAPQRTAPAAVPPVEKPQPAAPQKPAAEQRTAAAPQPQSDIPPRRSVPQPTQQRPVQQQTPPHPGNPVRQTPPAQQVPNRAPQQPYQPPMPNAGNRPPMNQRPQQPGYPRRPQQPGRPVQKRSKADGFIVIAIITAIIALAVMIFGFLVSREGPDIQSIILPAQTDTATVQSAPGPDND